LNIITFLCIFFIDCCTVAPHRKCALYGGPFRHPHTLLQGPRINYAPQTGMIADKTRYEVKFFLGAPEFSGSIGKKLYILVGGAQTNDLLITKAYSTVALFLLCYFMKTYKPIYSIRGKI
jgi:hypothetical protein